MSERSMRSLGNRATRLRRIAAALWAAFLAAWMPGLFDGRGSEMEPLMNEDERRWPTWQVK